MELDWNQFFDACRDDGGPRHRCAECDTDHQGLPDLAFRFPDDVFEVPASERALRVQHSSDLCVLDGERHFLRAVLPMAIVGTEAEYCYGLWVEVSGAVFERYRAIFDDDPPPGEGPYAGRVGNAIPGYADTLGLGVRAHLVPDGKRPRLELTDTAHAHDLVEHQRRGVELAHLLRVLAPFIDRAGDRRGDGDGGGDGDGDGGGDGGGDGDGSGAPGEGEGGDGA